MNEPNAFGPEQGLALSDLSARSLRAVRQAEQRAGGHRHLMLFEPSALWSETGSGSAPDFPHDRDVVYAPHIYTGGFTGGPITAAAFEVARTEARGFGGAPVCPASGAPIPAVPHPAATPTSSTTSASRTTSSSGRRCGPGVSRVAIPTR